jgi:hypothetical protein
MEGNSRGDLFSWFSWFRKKIVRELILFTPTYIQETIKFSPLKITLYTVSTYSASPAAIATAHPLGRGGNNQTRG